MGYNEENIVCYAEIRVIHVLTLLSGGEMKEAEYQQHIVSRIYDILPGEPLRDIIVYINDPNYIQGIPDLSVFYQPTAQWAMVEVKMSADARERPNQRWYIEHWGKTIFTAFIYPENEEEVLIELSRSLQQPLASGGQARFPGRQ